MTPGRRDDHGAARAGVRQRRRHGDRRALPGRALQPAAARARRPADLRDLLRRRPDGRGLARRRRRSPATSGSARSSTSTTTTTSRSTARRRSPSRPRTRARASRRTAGTSSTSTTPRTWTRIAAALAGGARGAERPSLIVLRSHIAYPAPHAQDTAKAHGSPLGEAEVRATKERLGWDPDAHVPRARRGARAHGRRRRAGRRAASASGTSASRRGRRPSPRLREDWDADHLGRAAHRLARRAARGSRRARRSPRATPGRR